MKDLAEGSRSTERGTNDLAEGFRSITRNEQSNRRLSFYERGTNKLINKNRNMSIPTLISWKLYCYMFHLNTKHSHIKTWFSDMHIAYYLVFAHYARRGGESDNIHFLQYVFRIQNRFCKSNYLYENWNKTWQVTVLTYPSYYKNCWLAHYYTAKKK